MHLIAAVLSLTVACQWDRSEPDAPPKMLPPPAQVTPTIPINLDDAPNIILITIDTLRADHLAIHGYHRETAPSISKLATQGVTFMDAVAPAPWTLPTLASIHSSLYPSEHAVVGAKTRLSASVDTLAEILQRAGYTTIGVVSNRFASTNYGMSQGFDFFDDSQIVGHHEVSSPGLTRIATEAVATVGDPPFFLWVHYFDPHFSYVRHPEFGFAEGYNTQFGDTISNANVREAFGAGGVSEADIAYAKGVYDEEIAFTDRWIGALLNHPSLQSHRGRVTVLTADHGEYFMERGRFFHGEDVYTELVHVPLIIAGDIQRDLIGSTVTHPVSLTSIPATLMSRLGIRDHDFKGSDLLASTGDSAPKPAFAEGSHLWGRGNTNKAIVSPAWKLIQTPSQEAFELYDRRRDPTEKNNRYSELRTAETESLKQALINFPESPALDPDEAKTDAETLRQLEALGYVE